MVVSDCRTDIAVLYTAATEFGAIFDKTELLVSVVNLSLSHSHIHRVTVV